MSTNNLNKLSLLSHRWMAAFIPVLTLRLLRLSPLPSSRMNESHLLRLSLQTSLTIKERRDFLNLLSTMISINRIRSRSNLRISKILFDKLTGRQAEKQEITRSLLLLSWLLLDRTWLKSRTACARRWCAVSRYRWSSRTLRWECSEINCLPMSCTFHLNLSSHNCSQAITNSSVFSKARTERTTWMQRTQVIWACKTQVSSMLRNQRSTPIMLASRWSSTHHRPSRESQFSLSLNSSPPRIRSGNSDRKG